MIYIVITLAVIGVLYLVFGKPSLPPAPKPRTNNVEDWYCIERTYIDHRTGKEITERRWVDEDTFFTIDGKVKLVGKMTYNKKD